MKNYQSLKLEIKESVLTVWLNRPQVHNAFNEVMIKELMAEGIISIAKGDNPRLLEQKLNAYLAPQFRESTFQ